MIILPKRKRGLIRKWAAVMQITLRKKMSNSNGKEWNNLLGKINNCKYWFGKYKQRLKNDRPRSNFSLELKLSEWKGTNKIVGYRK